MNTLIISIISLILFTLNCGSNESNQAKEAYEQEYAQMPSIEENEIFKEYFTLDLIMGEESGLKDEFLLARPQFLKVNDEGDMIVSDENSIKVYDKNGKGKKIIGRLGQGPGEFEGEPYIFLGPSGYISAVVSRMAKTYSIFSSDFAFIEKNQTRYDYSMINYLKSKENSLFSSYLIIYPLNETEKVYLVESTKSSQHFISLLYESPDTLIEIVHCKDPSYAGSGSRTNAFGGFFFKPLPGRRVIYINTGEDVFDEDEGSYYTMHVVSLDTFEDSIIRRPFNPSLFDKSWIKRIAQRAPPKFRKTVEKDMKYINKIKYNPSIVTLKNDGNYVFAYKSYNDDKGILYNDIDIFDINLPSEKYIKSVVVPAFVSRPGVIKNGYYHKVFYTTETGFPEIRRYKINPSFYGK